MSRFGFRKATVTPGTFSPDPRYVLQDQGLEDPDQPGAPQFWVPWLGKLPVAGAIQDARIYPTQHPEDPSLVHYEIGFQPRGGRGAVPQSFWASPDRMQGILDTAGVTPQRLPRSYDAQRGAVWQKPDYQPAQFEFGQFNLADVQGPKASGKNLPPLSQAGMAAALRAVATRAALQGRRFDAPGVQHVGASSGWRGKSFGFVKGGGYRLQGEKDFQGLKVSIENRVGSVRRGKGWETKMYADYGYLPGYLGVDGDPLDVYVGPNADAPKVFVVHQHAIGKVAAWGQDRCPKCGELPQDCWHDLDEDKVMLGYLTRRAAVHAYNRQYDDWRFLGPITELTLPEFRRILQKVKVKPRLIKALGDEPLHPAEQYLRQTYGVLPDADHVAAQALQGGYGGWLTPSGSFTGHIGGHGGHSETALGALTGQEPKLGDYDAERRFRDQSGTFPVDALRNEGFVRLRSDDGKHLVASFARMLPDTLGQLKRVARRFESFTWSHQDPASGSYADGTDIPSLLTHPGAKPQVPVKLGKSLVRRHGTLDLDGIAAEVAQGGYQGWWTPYGWTGHLGEGDYPHENSALGLAKSLGVTPEGEWTEPVLAEGNVRITAAPTLLHAELRYPAPDLVKSLRDLWERLGEPPFSYELEGRLRHGWDGLTKSAPRRPVATREDCRHCGASLEWESSTDTCNRCGKQGTYRTPEKKVEKSFSGTATAAPPNRSLSVEPRRFTSDQAVAEAFLAGEPVPLDVLEAVPQLHKSLLGEWVPWDLRLEKGGPQGFTPDQVQAVLQQMQRRFPSLAPEELEVFGEHPYAGWLYPDGTVSRPIRQDTRVGAEHHAGVALAPLRLAGVNPLAYGNPAVTAAALGFQRLLADPGSYVGVQVSEGLTPEQWSTIRKLERRNRGLREFRWDYLDIPTKQTTDSGVGLQGLLAHPVVRQLRAQPPYQITPRRDEGF